MVLATVPGAMQAHSVASTIPAALGKRKWQRVSFPCRPLTSPSYVAQWASMFPDCGGQMQSPINIDTSSTSVSLELQPVELAGYRLDPREQLRLENNGHTVVLELPSSLTIASGYPQEYRASQLHLHWGSPEGPGSEHTVDGRRYDGELHVVYYNPSYQSIKEAMRQPGGLAVLAAFLQVGPEDNEHYQPLLEQLPEVQEKGKKTTVDGFDIKGLLPTSLSRYYRYSGSLTTPPCYQTVNWTVFNQTVLLSQKQISLLETTLQGDHEELLQNNFRPTQSLHGRKVLASFQAALSPRQAPIPDGGAPPVTPAPDGNTESPDGAPGAGAGCVPCADAEQQLGFSLRTADVLAGLFGVLFAVTALALLIYVHKQRSQNQRLSPQAQGHLHGSHHRQEPGIDAVLVPGPGL
ncbi:carbonic anhydrase 9 isoform X2 [Pelodiscus sinensis]|uniref:carbonic anhydrase 9 isoform X2 n=2 Tax=Pelodiscus sinensis TaxID=13735 RepID=UPI003F6B4329